MNDITCRYCSAPARRHAVTVDGAQKTATAMFRCGGPRRHAWQTTRPATADEIQAALRQRGFSPQPTARIRRACT